MSAVKKQALIEAPVERTWELVGNPPSYSEWWPRVLEVRGERFEEGDVYEQKSRGPMKVEVTDFVIEKREDLHEIGLRCQKSGMYARWVLTPAQANTFVDIEFGMEPGTFPDRAWDIVAGRMFFRRWLEQSV